MSDERISELPEVTSPLTTDPVPLTSGGATSKVQVQNLIKAAPPQVHAASHASAGTDPVTIAESQVTGLTADLALKAPLVSPALTGNPTAPTQTQGDSSTKLATTAFVAAVNIPESQVTGLVADLAAKVPTTRQVLAGAGLTGGGALSVDQTISLSAPVSVPNGGTGVGSFAVHGVVLGNGVGAITSTTEGATNTLLHGNTGGFPTFSAVVEGDISLSDVTTDNVSTSAHGFAPKAPNDGSKFLNGLGAYAVPGTETPVTSVGTVNDLAFSNASTIRMNNATLSTITGLAAGVAGQRVKIVSVGTGQVDLSNQDAGSQAANRLINVVTGIKTSLGAGHGWAEYEYDATTLRWRLVGHDQGALIGFTSTWASLGVTQPVVGNGTLTANYYLHGALLHVEIELDAGSTTTFGQAGNNWAFSLPANPSGIAVGACMLYDNDGAGITAGIAVFSGAGPGGAVPASASGNATPSSPFTWAVSDIIRMILDYVIS